MSHPARRRAALVGTGFFVATPVFAIALILLIPILRIERAMKLQRMHWPLWLCLHRLDVSDTSVSLPTRTMPTDSFATSFLPRN